jgi:hypothetical protein
MTAVALIFNTQTHTHMLTLAFFNKPSPRSARLASSRFPASAGSCPCSLALHDASRGEAGSGLVVPLAGPVSHRFGELPF